MTRSFRAIAGKASSSRRRRQGMRSNPGRTANARPSPGFCSVLTAALLAAASVGAASPAAGHSATASPVTACDPIDDSACLLPFPNDRFTVPADTPTGRRVELPAEGMPTNLAGKGIEVTEWNRNDGFSPGSMILAHVPGIDLQTTFGLPRGVQVLDRPALSLAAAAPIVLVDLDTGARVGYYVELDGQAGAVSTNRRLLFVRPLETLRSAHTYAVALRSLRDATGRVIPPDPVFEWYRDKRGHPPAGVEPARTATFERLFGDLAEAGVARDDLYLAWSFTVASDEGLTARAVHIRDEAFTALGDEDLTDGVVDGRAPTFTVTEVENVTTGPTMRRVRGTVLVPNYLHTLAPPVPAPDGGAALALLLVGTEARFAYAGGDPGPSSLPVRNRVAPWLSVPYSCEIPRTATSAVPATPLLFGHGVLGSRDEVGSASTAGLRERNFAPCGADFAGMSLMDLTNVAATVQDLSRFAVMADRLQQGFLNFLFLGRALAHPGGFAAHAAFRSDNGPVVGTDGLGYVGSSQGAILGGAVMALAPDSTVGVLDVTGVNYSTLLNRSVVWEGGPLGNLYYGSYRDPIDRQLGFALLQMLWDRAEGNGYARRLTNDPLPNTPSHDVLLHVALGDFQVANVAAEVQARSVGARLLHTSLAPGRHWSNEPAFGLVPFDVAKRLSRGLLK